MIVQKMWGDRARIEELIAREESRVRRAFRQFLDEVRSAAVRRQVRLELERRGVEAALRLVDSHVVRLGTVVSQVFQSSALSASASFARNLAAAARVAITFDPTYPRAAELMRSNTLAFVREFTSAQRAATRVALIEALTSGAGPIEVARAFRDSIGLTEAQLRAVANYRRLLEAGDAQALVRDLRDRRFDPSVRRLVEDGEPLGAARIQRMVEQYRNRYLQYRAETIARTETIRIANQARTEAMRQVLEQAEISSSKVKRTWRATMDPRTRDTHAAMDGQERGMNEPFDSPSGAQLMMPGDAELGAPASEIINCRCVVLIDIAE